MSEKTIALITSVLTFIFTKYNFKSKYNLKIARLYKEAKLEYKDDEQVGKIFLENMLEMTLTSLEVKFIFNTENAYYIVKKLKQSKSYLLFDHSHELYRYKKNRIWEVFNIIIYFASSLPLLIFLQTYNQYPDIKVFLKMAIVIVPFLGFLVFITLWNLKMMTTSKLIVSYGKKVKFVEKKYNIHNLIMMFELYSYPNFSKYITKVISDDNERSKLQKIDEYLNENLIYIAEFKLKLFTKKILRMIKKKKLEL